VLLVVLLGLQHFTGYKSDSLLETVIFAISTATMPQYFKLWSGQNGLDTLKTLTG
jgi:hypothetical protein